MMTTNSLHQGDRSYRQCLDLREILWGVFQFCSPHPKSLSQAGRGTLNPAPLLPFWEKGLGDEGQTCKREMHLRLWGAQSS